MLYDVVFTSPANVAANTVFGNIPAAAAQGFVLRRLKGGCRVNSGAPTSQQIHLGLYRSIARGAQTSTTAPERLSQLAPATCPIAGVDTLWSTPPTLGTLIEIIPAYVGTTFDIWYPDVHGIEVQAGVANGLAFNNVAVALPANHQWALTATIEA